MQEQLANPLPEVPKCQTLKIRSGPTQRRKVQRAPNPIQHGLTARNAILLQDEDPELHEQLREAYYAQWQPDKPIDADLVDDMIRARWLLRGYTTIETALLDHKLDSILPALDAKYERIDPAAALAFKSLADGSSALQLLRRSFTGLCCAYRGAFNALLALRAAQTTDPPAQPGKNDESNPPHSQVIEFPEHCPTTPRALPRPEEPAA